MITDASTLSLPYALPICGDPMIMGEAVLRRYIEPLLEVETLESIRIGTKSLAYWPQRFVTDPDADDTLRLFEQVRSEEHTSELQSRENLVCRLLLEKKKS